MASYGDLPSSANTSAVEAFTIHVSGGDLERMHTLIKLSRVADPCYENTLPDGSRDLGVRRDWLLQAKKVWEVDFDWSVPTLRQ
jgi:microsomal epoxide hydrolase